MSSERPKKNKADAPAPGPGRLQSRTIRGEAKRRPKDIKSLLACLQANTLDGRRREALQYEAVKEALSQDPAEVAKALLRHDVAVLAVVVRSIVEDAQQGGGFLRDGTLAPALGNDLVRFQAAQTKTLEALLRLEGNPKSRTKDGATILDVASIVMADNMEDQ